MQQRSQINAGNGRASETSTQGTTVTQHNQRGGGAYNQR
jgi:hypothetical protein